MLESLGWQYFFPVFFELYFFYILCRNDVIEELSFEFECAKYIRWIHLIALIIIADPNAVLISRSLLTTTAFTPFPIAVTFTSLYYLISFFIIWVSLPFKYNTKLVLTVLHAFSLFALSARW